MALRRGAERTAAMLSCKSHVLTLSRVSQSSRGKDDSSGSYIAAADHGSSSTRLCGGLAAVTSESWENLVLVESRMWGALVVELLGGLRLGINTNASKCGVSVCGRFDNIRIWEPVVHINRRARPGIRCLFVWIWICSNVSTLLFPTIRLPLDRLAR